MCEITEFIIRPVSIVRLSLFGRHLLIITSIPKHCIIYNSVEVENNIKIPIFHQVKRRTLINTGVIYTN